jgi:hypothetical protein
MALMAQDYDAMPTEMLPCVAHTLWAIVLAGHSKDRVSVYRFSLYAQKKFVSARLSALSSLEYCFQVCFWESEQDIFGQSAFFDQPFYCTSPGG